MKRRQKTGFLSSRGSKEKERRKRKSEEKEWRRREKSSGRTLSFYNNYFKDYFWPKKLFDAKGPFGNNVIKNPVRYTFG